MTRLILRTAGIAAGVLVLLAIGWIAWVRVPSGTSPTLQTTLHQLAGNRPCSRLQIIGVRGHSDPPSDVGPDNRALILLLEARLGPSNTADVVSLPYAQGPTLGIVPIWVPRDISSGADALDEYLRLRSATCPAETRVLVAQSEGAALTHLALPRVAERVEATVLLGDPLHLSSAPYDENLGETSDGELVPWMGMGIDVARRTWTDPVPPSLASRIRSYCFTHDHVCSHYLFDRQPSTHVDYRNDPVVTGSDRGVLDRAVDFIVGRLGGVSH